MAYAGEYEGLDLASNDGYFVNKSSLTISNVPKCPISASLVKTRLIMLVQVVSRVT